MDFQIELRPHTGVRQFRDGDEIREEVVEFDQYRIFVVGPDLQQVRGKKEEMIGYVGKQPGQPINLLRNAAAFGPQTLRIFGNMILKALIAEARRRVSQAREQASEAEGLRREAEELLMQAADGRGGEGDAADALKLADEALDESNRMLMEASSQHDDELASQRPLFEPDPSESEEAPVVARASDSHAEAANEQNL